MSLRRAFTLVELLVVIGIIAILVAILLPALQAARQHAVNVQCLSNLRGCGQVLYIYATQNRGMFPPMSLQSPETLVAGGTIINPDNPNFPGPATFRYPDVKDAIARIVNPGSNPDPNDVNFSPGGLKIFYCPGNFFWDADRRRPAPSALSHWPEDFMYSQGRITYWYVGNPNPWYPKYHYPGPFGAAAGGLLPGSAPIAAPNGFPDWRFWDTNQNGDNRDEYIVKLGDKKMADNVLMTDHSRQLGSGPVTQFGFQFVHGSTQNTLDKAWKNNLYGDGHAESRRPRRSSFGPGGKTFINTNPSPDEVQPRWGRADLYQMW